MSIRYVKKTILCILFSSLAVQTQAQVDFTLNLQNMHLARGAEVTDGLVITSEWGVTNKTQQLRFALWGGMNTQATFKELDYYIAYATKNFSFSLWDIYNFSSSATYNNKEVFNYNPRETGRFLDATVGYRISKKVPLAMSWSTIVFGRDRTQNNDRNRYSTFLYAEYLLWNKNLWTISTGLGGVFALYPDRDYQGKRIPENFYEKKAGISHISLKGVYQYSIFNAPFPVFIMALFNPISNEAFLQVGVQVLRF